MNQPSFCLMLIVDILPAYPMTIAVMARDDADPKTGMEYANTNIGDGGFILKSVS